MLDECVVNYCINIHQPSTRECIWSFGRRKESNIFLTIFLKLTRIVSAGRVSSAMISSRVFLCNPIPARMQACSQGIIENVGSIANKGDIIKTLIGNKTNLEDGELNLNFSSEEQSSAGWKKINDEMEIDQVVCVLLQALEIELSEGHDGARDECGWGRRC